MADTLGPRLRVAMIGQKGYPPVHGGIEKHVAELAARLPGLGVAVDLYSRPHYSSARGPADLPGVTILRIPSLPTKHLDAITHTILCTGHTFWRRPDIVHYHALGPGLLAGLPRWLAGRPTVVTVHGLDWQRDKWGPLARSVLRMGESASVSFPRRTIVVSRALRDYFQARHGRDTAYIPNGIAAPVPRPPQLLKERGIAPGFVLFVGRLVPEKGCHLLLRAWEDLGREGRQGRRLIIAGDAGFTPGYAQGLRRTAGADVEFVGFVHGPLLEELYTSADLVVLPSSLEGLSITLLEGLSYGRCCLASDIPPNREAAEQHAVYFRSGDVADLTARLREVLADAPLRERLGRTGRTHVLGRYDWDAVAEDTAALYRELVPAD